MKVLSVGVNARNVNIVGIHWRCLKVTREQIEWIFNHVERITNKYLDLFPLNDETWHQLIEECKEINVMSKNNKTVSELLLITLEYFDKLDVVYRRENK